MKLVSEFYRMGGRSGSSIGALISDDRDETFRLSSNSILGGGEGIIAMAPDGNLILNAQHAGRRKHALLGLQQRRRRPLVRPAHAGGLRLERGERGDPDERQQADAL